MAKELGLGKWGKIRSYFEEDTLFHDPVAEKILGAYEEACRSASYSAKHAIDTGAMKDMRLAQWNHCVALTLEAVLAAIPHSSASTCEHRRQDEEIELPDAPKFD